MLGLLNFGLSLYSNSSRLNVLIMGMLILCGSAADLSSRRRNGAVGSFSSVWAAEGSLIALSTYAIVDIGFSPTWVLAGVC